MSKFRKNGLWHDAWKRFRRNRNAMIGLSMTVFLIFIAIAAPLIAPQDPIKGHLKEHDLPPFWLPGAIRPGSVPAAVEKSKSQAAEQPANLKTFEISLDEEPTEDLRVPDHYYFFGTDDLGRDIFSRVVYGARLSLIIGFLSVAIGLAVGLTLGLISGFWGGWLDDLIMRTMDILLSIPYVLLAILIVAVLGPSLVNSMIAIGILGIPQFARIARGSVLSVKESEYVQACRVLGGGNLRIMIRHILRNSLSPLIVQTSLRFASAILSAAALGFLGLGAQPPAPEWGAMLADGRKLLLTSPWAVIFPGMAITIFVISFNILGDGLRDALDVRIKD